MKHYLKYFKELIVLSLPILAGSLGNVLIGTGSVIVAGRHSTVTLGAISIATAILMTILIAAIGLISSVSPVMSNLRGARKPTKSLFKATLIFSLTLACIFFIIARIIMYTVPYIGLASELTVPVMQYMDIASYSMFGVCLFVALKEYLQAYEIVVFANTISIAGIFVNFFLCWILVFGWGPIPPMGIIGLAIANCVIRILEALILLAYCQPFMKGRNRRYHLYIKELIKTGYPISLAVFCEFLGFNATAVIMGKFSTVYAAAHNVILTITGATYMLPFSIGTALAVKVGFANGEKNIVDIKKYIKTGMVIILTIMFLSMFIYLFFTKQLMGIFTKDEAVIAAGAPVAVIVICFLFFDGLQCACSGALRGLKETKAMMYAMVFSFGCIGMPIGCVLAFKYNIVLMGFWFGLAVALFSASILSTLILVRKVKKLEKKYVLQQWPLSTSNFEG